MKKKSQAYCWVVLICASLLAFCTNGLTANCISISLGYVRSVWNYTNSQISVFNSLRSLFSLLGVFAMGWMYRHVSLRRGAAFWCAMNGVAYLLFSRADHPALFYFTAALLGFSFSLANLTIGSMLVRRWFKDKLGFALAIFSSSTGLATLLAPGVITRIAEKYSLRTAFMSIGFFILALAAVYFLFARSTPAEAGMEPYTLPDSVKAEGGKRAKYVVLESNGPLTKGEWRYLGFFFLLLGLGNSQALSNFSLHFRDCGYSPELIATAVSAYGVCIGVTKIIFGFAVDRFGGKDSTSVCGAFLVLGFFMVCLARYIRLPFMPVLATGLCGVGFTAFSVGRGIWASEMEAPEHYDEALRRFWLLEMIGGVIGSLIPGFLADRFGSYVPAYGMSVVFGAIFLIALRHMYNRKTHLVTAAGGADKTV